MAGSVEPDNKSNLQADGAAARCLPVEPGTIELRSDGSVTVAGHRIRLRQIVEAIESGNISSSPSLADQFPTIDQALMGRVAQYVARFPEEIACYMFEERDMEQHFSSLGTHVSIDELRRFARQAR